jgi:hypothetical protein
MSFQISNITLDNSINQTQTFENLQQSPNTISGDIIPSSDNTYTLGTLNNKFANCYLSKNSITIGVIPISSTDTSLNVGSIIHPADVAIPYGNLALKSATISSTPSGSLSMPSTNVGEINPNNIKIVGTLSDTSLLPQPPVSAYLGDGYVIGGNIYACTYIDPNETYYTWTDIGSIQGPQGPEGIQGPMGPSLPTSDGTTWGSYLLWNRVGWDIFGNADGGPYGYRRNVILGYNQAFASTGRVKCQKCVIIGNNAGGPNQDLDCVFIGTNTGNNPIASNQYVVSIGTQAGQNYQGLAGTAIGYQAGLNSQGFFGLAIGTQAGENYQGSNAVAIGWNSGQISQGENSVSIGTQTGLTNQGQNSVAIGWQAGLGAQGPNSIAIGSQAGKYYQWPNSIAIGTQAGFYRQGTNAISIGNFTGVNSQLNQPANSIILNTSGINALNPFPTAQGFFVNPISVNSGSPPPSPANYYPLYYNSMTSEIFTSVNGTNSDNWGEIPLYILNVITNPVPFTNAKLKDFDSIVSVPTQINDPNAATAPFCGGRVRTQRGYNTPATLSFNVFVENIIGASTYCAVGFSSNPSNSNQNDFGGYFDAAFLISLTGVQILYEYNNYSSLLLGLQNWNKNTKFTINFDGYNFNYLISQPTNDGSDQINTQQVFSSYPVNRGSTIYYFTTSFATGIQNGAQTPEIVIENINFGPYSALPSPPTIFTPPANIASWSSNGTQVSTIQPNNTYYIPTNGSIIANLPLGTTTLTNFIFSFVAFSTIGNNGVDCYIQQINLPSSTTIFNLNLNNFILSYRSNLNQLIQIGTYCVGDNIQIFYQISSPTISSITVYKNNFAIYTTSQGQFNPTSVCFASIINNGISPINVINPLYYNYILS